ncbi:hypothetical protein BJ973_001512 [Actinoplanes tereljensis]|uniref:Lipoprotein n=1 Tax=Paractinoplanes tereljensis TaxID=571912 RepID=A0A919NML1_9ACTN|nr:hypothetical protein [Actinoplanes tereljensis]GIF20582.1 hypothetical protein Ate02nite_33120 [Actinoplanes tereljensis]
MRKPFLAVLLAVALTGCTPVSAPPRQSPPPDLKPADLVGAWKDNRRGGVLTFTAAGRFAGDDLGFMFLPFPDDLPAGFDQKTDRAAGLGEWQLGPSLADPNGPNDYVRLNFLMIAGREVRASINKLEAQTRDPAVVLVFYIDDPDLNNEVVFSRCPDCPSPAPS